MIRETEHTYLYFMHSYFLRQGGEVCPLSFLLIYVYGILFLKELKKQQNRYKI